jgi:hypothetical protein
VQHSATLATFVLALLVPSAGHAASGHPYASAFLTAVDLCSSLGGPRGTSSQLVADGDVLFYFNSARLEASKQLWSSGGLRFLEAQLRRSPPGVRRECIKQLLKEARSERLDR